MRIINSASSCEDEMENEIVYMYQMSWEGDLGRSWERGKAVKFVEIGREREDTFNEAFVWKDEEKKLV
jgi:hypothetical protein